MKFRNELIRNWFGFARRERRASFILLFIVVLTLILRYTIPEKNISIEDITTSFSGVDSLNRIIQSEVASIEQPFTSNKNSSFNPGISRSVNIADTLKRKFQNDHFRRLEPLLDINSCDSASLCRLPGIGPVLSARIIKYRHLLGGFARIDQLKEVYGLPEETYDLIKGRIISDTIAIRKIDINSAGYKELARLPYFEKYDVSSILKYRELKGKFTSISDLINNKILTVEKASKVKAYLSFK
jgi:DNA uptake protein ComE-like DNA-binding protein